MVTEDIIEGKDFLYKLSTQKSSGIFVQWSSVSVWVIIEMF